MSKKNKNLSLDFVKKYEKKLKKRKKNKNSTLYAEYKYRTDANQREALNKLLIENRLIYSAKRSIVWCLDGLTPYQKKRALLDAQYEISQ